MSLHPSLHSRQGKTGVLRNVMKRFERIRHMMEHDTWTDGRSIFGLPKIKQERIKARKAAGKDDEAAAETATPAKTPAASE